MTGLGATAVGVDLASFVPRPLPSHPPPPERKGGRGLGTRLEWIQVYDSGPGVLLNEYHRRSKFASSIK